MKPNKVRLLNFADEDNLEADVEWAENNFDEFTSKNEDVCGKVDAIRHSTGNNLTNNMKINISEDKGDGQINNKYKFDIVKTKDPIS